MSVWVFLAHLQLWVYLVSVIFVILYATDTLKKENVVSKMEIAI